MRSGNARGDKTMAAKRAGKTAATSRTAAPSRIAGSPLPSLSVGITIAVAAALLGVLFAAMWAVGAVVFGRKEPISIVVLLVFGGAAGVAAWLGLLMRNRDNHIAWPIVVGLGILVAAAAIAAVIAGARGLTVGAGGGIGGEAGAAAGEGYGGWLWAGLPLMGIFTMHLASTLGRHVNMRSSEQVPDIVFRFLRIVGVLFFAIAVALPFYFMIIASLRPRAFLLQNPTDLTIPLSQNLSQLFTGYTNVFGRFRFGRYILNSTVVSLLTVIITLVPAVLGAYAVTRLRFKGRRVLSNSILLIYMFPTIVLVIPLYSIFTQLGVRNSLLGLLLVYPAMTTPVALYMLRSYFQTLPQDIEEAGLIDGCTRGGVIVRITLPLSLPALASVALYVFMIAWNEFLFAFMFLDNPDIFTLSRGVVSLNTQEVPRQFLMAGSVIITVPVMALFFYFEKFLVGGLAAGGVKG